MHAKKVLNKKVTEKWIFYFYLILGDFFALYYADSNSASNFGFYDSNIEFCR
jgi:hypothetical protein